MIQANKEDLLNKLQALLEMTEKNGCTEAEANLAASKAQALMDKHSLSVADLKAASPNDICGADWVYNGKKKSHESRFTAAAIAEFTATKAWSEREADTALIRFFGLKSDVAIAVYLFKTFQAAMDFEWTRYWKRHAELTAMHGKTVRRSFMAGMYRRLNERLRLLIEERERRIEDKNEIRSIVIVKEQIVIKAFTSLGLSLRTRSHRTLIRDNSAYLAGHDAGGRVGIDSGRLE